MKAVFLSSIREIWGLFVSWFLDWLKLLLAEDIPVEVLAEITRLRRFCSPRAIPAIR